MIIIEDDRCLVTYARVNRRVRWRYAEYCGRWKTREEAIKNAKEHFPGQRIEYRIENMETDEVTTGFIG